MSEIIELDLSAFGRMELEEFAELLTRFVDDKTTWRVRKFFNFNDGLKIGYNMSSTTAFFYNDEMLTVVIVEGRLELFLSCPVCIYENNESEFTQFHNKNCEGCQEVIKHYELE